MSKRAIPIGPFRNEYLAGIVGLDVIDMESIDIRPGDTIRFVFEQYDAGMRRGIWIGTNGLLQINNQRMAQFTLWADTAPKISELLVIETDGHLRFYNVWNPGTGIGGHMSMIRTSGMIRSTTTEGDSVRYCCTDKGEVPVFERLVFSVSRITAAD